MKVIVIPDMHGSHNWSKALDLLSENPDAYVVGLGDWVDCFNNKWPDQGLNLEIALDWFREDTDHRFFCIGNHDWSYISNTENGRCVSGHQYDRAKFIRTLLNKNRDILYIAKEIDGFVFSHAGFTKTWYDSLNRLVINDNPLTREEIEKSFEYISSEDVEDVSLDILNEYFQGKRKFNDSYSAHHFEELLDWYGLCSSNGDEICQGPLWVRPHSLLSDSKFDKQIVGHTEIKLDKLFLVNKEDKYIGFVDTSDRRNVFVFDTEDLSMFHELDYYKPSRNYV